MQDANVDVSPISQQSNEQVKPYTNGNGVIGNVNDYSNAYKDDDVFQHLQKPQQDVLLLHGPRQKYCLQTTGQIPELRSEREILIQVSINPDFLVKALTSAGCGNRIESS